jgi:hypothetical protein
MDRAAFDTLTACGLVRDVAPAAAEPDGWWRVDCDVPGGLEAAAEVVSRLTRANVSVARCERVKLSLAELLERVLARHAAGNA